MNNIPSHSLRSENGGEPINTNDNEQKANPYPPGYDCDCGICNFCNGQSKR